jgi:hypothetical protein
MGKRQDYNQGSLVEIAFDTSTKLADIDINSIFAAFRMDEVVLEVYLGD